MALLQQTETTTTTSGQAAVTTTVQAARAAALADAQRAATDEVLGATVTAQTEVSNYTLVRDTIVRRSGGLARLVSVDSESQKNGVYTVRATFAVSKTALETQIRALLDKTGDPRILVILPERSGGTPVDAPTAEALLSAALIDRGFRVLNTTQSQKLTLRSQVLADPKAAAQIAARFGADLLVTGSGDLDVNAVVPDALKSAGLASYSAKLSVQVVDLASAQQLFSVSSTVPVAALNAPAAAAKAFGDSAQKAVNPLVARVIDWLAGTGSTARRVFTVTVTGFPTFRAYSAWLARARGESLLSTVTSRAFDAGGSDVQVEFGGQAEDLANLLEGLGLSVTQVSGAEIRATYRP